MSEIQNADRSQILADIATVLGACRVRLRGAKVAVAEYYVARPEVTDAMRRLVKAVQGDGIDVDLIVEAAERPDGIFAGSTAPID